MTTDTRKQYVISLSSLNGTTEELVGMLAKEIETVQLLSINTPIGFVVTTHSFDDYLIANDLLDFISPRINDIDYADEKSVRRASDEIRHAIQNGVMPDIIAGPIIQAYSGLSGFYDAFVAIKQSPINTTLDEKTYSETKIYTNITGRERLIEKIKEAWGQLFTVDALKQRAEGGYEGYLSEALVVQKMLQAEVSGKLYSYNSYDGDKSQVEVQAFFGLNDEDLWKNMVPDSYLLNKKTQEILEKKIIGQDYMYVRKGRTADKSPIIKVPISKLWHKKQKLEDKFILALFRQCVILEENFGKQIEVTWEFEASKLYIVDFDITRTERVAEVESIQPKIKPEQIVAEEETIEQPPQKFERKSIDDYVSEVGTISQSYSKMGAPEGDDQVVVDIKPIEELHVVAQGVGKGEKMVFGLAHFVHTDSDLEGLTGDEILIINTVDPNFYSVYNSVKGLIIIEDIDSSELLDVNVPVISNVPDAYDIFQENEVVTLRPWNSSVYLGAGKETVTEKTPQQKIAEEIVHEVKEAPVVPKSDIFDSSTDEEDDDSGDLIFDAKVQKPIAEPVNAEKAKVASSALPSTVLDFWQTYYPSKSAKALENIDGYVVRVADIIEKYDKTVFASELSSKLVEVLDFADGKPVVLVSAGREKLQEEIVEAEISAIASLRNKDQKHNLWYSFDNVADVDDLAKLKRLVTTKGLRRSASFKIFLSVHAPHSLITLKGMLATGVDGVILDLDLMYKEHTIKTKHYDPHIIEYIAHKIALVSEAQTSSMVLSYEYKLEADALKEMIKAGLNSLALDTNQIVELKPVVAELESKVKVENKKRRGRKRKEIDFGY